jgi:hypothetical protein
VTKARQLRDRIEAGIALILKIAELPDTTSTQSANLWCLIRTLDPSFETGCTLTVRCCECNKPVEPERQCYAIPMCKACMAPSDPLPCQECPKP